MRISRSTGAASGFLIILLALWAGIVPFVGPYFHYSFGSNTGHGILRRTVSGWTFSRQRSRWSAAF